MSTNSQKQNVFDVDCIDLTDEPNPRKKSNKKNILLVDALKPVEEIETLINNVFNKSSPKSSVLTQQKPAETRFITNIVSKTNEKVAEFGYSAQARTPVRKETTRARKNVVVLSSTVINPGKSQKPTELVNPGVSDIILTPSSSDIRNKKFPMNATNKNDDKVTLMAVRHLNTRPTPKLSPLTAEESKTGTPKPVATVSTPPTVPNLQFGTPTRITKPAVPVLKQNVAPQPISSQVSQPVCLSTDLPNVAPVKQVSAGRKVVHVLPKSLNEEKQLVQEIKRSPALPQLQNLCLPAKGKSRDEVLKALREVTASARIVNPDMQPISGKTLVQNPFSQKGNFRMVSPFKAHNEKQQYHFFRGQARKTYQKEATNVSSREFSHYVRTADACTDVTAPQENRQVVLNQSVNDTTSTQDNPTPSTSNTQVHSESVQQSQSRSPIILNSIVNKPLQNIVRPSAVRPILNNKVVKNICDQVGYTYKKGVTRIPTNQVRDEALPRPQIPVKNVSSMTTNETVTEENPFHSPPTTQVSPESFENESPPLMLQAVTMPQQSNGPNVIPTTSVTKSASRSTLRNPLNRVDVGKRTLQFCVPPTYDASPAVNLTDLAETVSAVANINGQTSEAEKANPIVYLLYPMNNKTGTVLPFKEGQIQQMVALVPSDSGLVPLTVTEKEEEEEEVGCGDYPLLPLATKKSVKETGKETQSHMSVATPCNETVEDDTDDVILINDDADIEIEPPALVRPVDISKIINRFNNPFPKGRCKYYNSDKKIYLKFFKGYTCREKQNPSCLREMKTLAKQYKKKADKMKQEVYLRYESNVIYCSSNENEFLPETVKVEIKEEAEDVEAVTILNDKEDAASEILPTIGDVISQVNREVFAMNQPQKVNKEGEVPPEEALELIKKGLEMIKHWSQENGTASKLETIIRNKLDDTVSTTERKKRSVPQKRTSKTDEGTQVVKKKRGRRPKTDKSEKRPTANASESWSQKVLRRSTVINATEKVVRERMKKPKAMSVSGSVRKRAVGRPKVTTDRSSRKITVEIPSDKKNSRKTGNSGDDGDDLFFVRRVDILKSSKRGRRRKQNLS